MVKFANNIYTEQTMHGLQFCQKITRNGLHTIENGLHYAN